VQAAAVRSIDPERAAAEPRVRAALGAVPVEDISAGIARTLRHMALRRKIAQPHMPAH